VRREGVSAAAAPLRRQGLIRYTRGRIAVLDRCAMETRVCECYAAVKREYDRLLPWHMCDTVQTAQGFVDSLGLR
jgi:hypothetical protein